jgi:hypothetical protein
LANGVIWVQKENTDPETALDTVVGLIVMRRESLGGSSRLIQSCAVVMVFTGLLVRC